MALRALPYPIDGNARGLYFRVVECLGIKPEWRDKYLAGRQLDDFRSAVIFARMHGFAPLPDWRTGSGERVPVGF